MIKSRPSEVFPKRLRDAREMRELTQEALASRAGLQSSAISHFESGTRKPSFDNLRRLADALQVSTDYLLGRTEEVSGAATSDQLHRHLDRMSEEDRELAEGFISLLEKRSKDRAKED